MEKDCPICGAKLVRPTGPKDSPLCVIGEFPGYEELQSLMPFIGNAGKVLYQELGRVGIDLKLCRVTNLWMHTPKDECRDWHYEQAIKEGKERQGILLLGSDTARYFAGKSISEISGLPLDVAWFPNAQVVIATFNPASLLKSGGVGEFRLAIHRFYKKVRHLL